MATPGASLGGSALRRRNGSGGFADEPHGQRDETTADEVGQRDGTLPAMIVFAGAVYFVICFTVSMSVKRLQKRLAK